MYKQRKYWNRRRKGPMATDTPSHSADMLNQITTLDSNSGLSFSTFLSREQLVRYCSNYKSPIPNLQDKYVTIKKLGQGAFGEVFKVALKADRGRIFAIKTMDASCSESKGCSLLALREVKILKALKHENVVQFIEIVKGPPAKQNNNMSYFFMVFEYCDFDLCGLLSTDKFVLNLSEKKWLLKHLLEGIYYLHHNHIMHRDLKTSNILVTRTGILKIADFGLARAFSSCAFDKAGRRRIYTPNVVTLWYRAPEILLRTGSYTAAIDMWSFGCIMFEVFSRDPLFKCGTETTQIQKIQSLCGSFDEVHWPGITRMSDILRTLDISPSERVVKTKLRYWILCHQALDLIDHCLVYDSSRRMTAGDALNHDYFWVDPMPLNPAPKFVHIKGELNEMNRKPVPQKIWW